MRETGETAAGLEKQSAILGAGAGLGGALFNFGAANNWWMKPAGAAASTYTPGSGMPLWR
jgi:glucokinase